MLWRHFNKRPIELEIVIKKVSISYKHKINVKLREGLYCDTLPIINIQTNYLI